MQQYLDTKSTSLSPSYISRKLQEKEMDSLATVLEREINFSKPDWRGAVLRHSQCFSSCPMPELKAVLLVTGNERHKSWGQALCPTQHPQMCVPCTALLHIPKNDTGWSLTPNLSHGLAGEQLYSLDPIHNKPWICL